MTPATEYEVQGTYWGQWVVVRRFRAYRPAADALARLCSPEWNTDGRRYRLVRRVSTVIVEG